MRASTARIALFTGIVAVAALAACGGGSSGGGGGGGGVPPTSPPTSTPTNAPGASGTASFNGTGLANASVVFTCGCSAQAGTATADGSGNFTLSASSNAVPPTPSPTYTMVPGRNYMVIAATSTHQEAWTILFLGSQPSHNLYMGSSGGDTTDVATTAAALYVFLNAQNESDTSFDDWNVNTIAAWAAELRSAPKTAQEQKLMTDITAAVSADTPLYPTIPDWDNDSGAANATIRGDVEAILPSSDAAIPTPCPISGGSPACTGAPTP
ncbi:MAG: hypothetical protein ACREMP_06065 [Candidatus Tyrphobacter sp.]